ncbi:MAG: VCBS repeat-containing protein [bacterium]|nr:VCBS repeat-containing protein [bacterium]
MSTASYRILASVTVAVAAAIAAPAFAAADYVVPLTVRFQEGAGESTPVRMQIDFDTLLRPEDQGRLLDPHTLTVARTVSGQITTFGVQFDEHLYRDNKGWIAWLAKHPAFGGEWILSFSLRALDGGMAPPPNLPRVGVGEELRFNGERWHPIGVPGMHQFPIPLDWNEDGLIDLLSTSHYSNAQGMPWDCIVYWRNIGTNEEPRYAVPLRVSADGVDRQKAAGQTEFEPRHDYISEYYLVCDVFDWFGTGRLDLITFSKAGGVRVYRNTGAFDAAGMPKLERALTLSVPPFFPPSLYLGFRVVDWDGSGRPSLLLGGPLPMENGQIALMRNVGGTPEKPEFESLPLPRNNFWQPKRNLEDWRTIREFPGFRAWSFDYFDVDHDGAKELLVMHGLHRPVPAIEVWRNGGTPEEPEMVQDGELPWSAQYQYFGFRFVKNAAFDGCLIGQNNSGWGIHYYERAGDDPFDKDCYRDAGPLLGEGTKLRVEGYVRAYPLSPTRSGPMDLVCGDEVGFISLVRDIGEGDRSAFAPPHKLTNPQDTVLHLTRESILHDDDGERNCGMTKPVVCDWDGDGNLDLIVGGNTNHIYWLRHYDPVCNTYREKRRIAVRGVVNPFGWRKGPAVCDFDGDGTLELITADRALRMCMFKQGGGADGRHVLEPPVPFKREGGSVLSARDVPPGNKYGMINVAVIDWTGNGVNDLLVSSKFTTVLVRNTGANTEPAFAAPEFLSTPDGNLSISTHEIHAEPFDWDDDGVMDLIVGAEAGTVYLFHRDWLNGIQHEASVKTN